MSTFGKELPSISKDNDEFIMMRIAKIGPTYVKGIIKSIGALRVLNEKFPKEN